MIGIIGPEDTTALIERIADELNLGSTIVTAKYQSSDETINLVKTLIPICQIILFSGILPYKIALSAGFNKEILDFIPHGGTDLFRTIALTALNNDKIGHIPKFSFDCIPIHDVQEAYDELNLIDDYHVIPLDADCASAPPQYRAYDRHPSIALRGRKNRLLRHMHSQYF